MNDPSAAALRRRNRELEILNALAEGLNASAELAASLDGSLARLGELLGLRTGWVWLLEESSGEPYLAAARDLPPGLAHPRAMEGGCDCLQAFAQGELDGPANVVTCSRLGPLAEGAAGLRFHASIPLHARGRRLGVMNLASAEWRALSAEELRLLHTVGEMVGVAVERARLFERSAAAGAAEERNRLAREIHDTLAQGLSAVTLQLETAEALLDRGTEPGRAARAVSTALAAARGCLEEARRSVLDLRAAPLEGRSLARALEELAESARGAGGPRVRCEVTGGATPLPARVEVALFRMAQEALGNALRHAAPRSVRLVLEAGPHGVHLAVVDDGCGFAPAQVAAGRFGLVGMRERVRLLGGTFELQSAPGVGTCVHATVPLGEAS